MRFESKFVASLFPSWNKIGIKGAKFIRCYFDMFLGTWIQIWYKFQASPFPRCKNGDTKEAKFKLGHSLLRLWYLSYFRVKLKLKSHVKLNCWLVKKKNMSTIINFTGDWKNGITRSDFLFIFFELKISFLNYGILHCICFENNFLGVYFLWCKKNQESRYVPLWKQTIIIFKREHLNRYCFIERY